MFSNKIDSNLNMSAVKALYDHYHSKVKTNPTLYQSGPEMITVILSQDLLDYCNASAGNSGGVNARPCGIRYPVKNSARALAQVFESVESLAKFISGSDCDGMYIAERVRVAAQARQQTITVAPLDRPMNSYILDVLYGRGTSMMLRNKFPKTVKDVINDYNSLTRGEFEAKYSFLVAVDSGEAV